MTATNRAALRSDGRFARLGPATDTLTFVTKIDETDFQEVLDAGSPFNSRAS
ncbi:MULTISPECIES: hypothetical protein [Natrialbaceae]|uniref:hypothetical protein n=1 Tax=Natrialbaceae TaxID=1644061 RepID=UPI00207C753E|nr:hypothetical protein [Natronococcus sp. CG52]